MVNPRLVNQPLPEKHFISRESLASSLLTSVWAGLVALEEPETRLTERRPAVKDGILIITFRLLLTLLSVKSSQRNDISFWVEQWDER